MAGYYRMLLLFWIILLEPNMAAGRYTAFNYGRNNGFPGDKVYDILQDSRGYIWLGTENGLVSFNGYEFKTYTTRDGLPGNEVLRIREDPQGRLWLLTFTNEVCYLRYGKIYNSKNDSLLSKLRFSAMPSIISFDRWNNTWITDADHITQIDSNGRVIVRGSIVNDQRAVSIFKVNDSGKAVFFNGLKFYEYNKDHVELRAELPFHVYFPVNEIRLSHLLLEEYCWTPLPVFIKRYLDGKDIYFEKQDLPIINQLTRISPDVLCLTTKEGAYLKDIYTGKLMERFLPGCNVTSCIMAKDSSLWFGTLGNGLFRYSHSPVQTISGINKSAISFLKARGRDLYSVAGGSDVLQIRSNTYAKPEVAHKQFVNRKFKHETICYADQDRQHNWIVCSDDLVRKYSKQLAGSELQELKIGYCKTTLEEGERFLLIGTTVGIYRLDKDRFVITDTLYSKRVTSIAKAGTTIYAGTLKGLIAFCEDKKSMSFLREPVLNRHITALCTDTDGNLWAANNAATLIKINPDNNKTIGIIDGHVSLGCNNISALRTSGKYLWVGSDNGLYAINNVYPFNVVKRFSYANGLSSNQINYLEIADGRVWVGTDKGLNFIDEFEVMPSNTKPVFIISRIENEKKQVYQTSSTMSLTYQTLQIDFDVIDHSEITKPIYAYRLNDNDWTETKNDNLYFPTIPYGNFTVSIRATSSSWTVPKTVTLSFYHAYPYYFSWWFIALAIVFTLLLIGILIRLFLIRVRKKDKEQLNMQQNILQLEQMALQGQMNPHFIFNCITAIRQYYNNGEVQKADRFINAFSGLIRTTFEMVNQLFTSLEKELHYLSLYLEVEQERFDQSFTFSISREIQVAASSIPVPAMLLQPLVENAVRHGVRHLPDGEGEIHIFVIQQQDTINIIIKDNGIGVAKALEIKQANNTNTSLTSTNVNGKRIDILNKLYGPGVTMCTEDVLNAQGEVAGTSVFISYPLNIYVFEQQIEGDHH